jgi:hypothetical protein
MNDKIDLLNKTVTNAILSKNGPAIEPVYLVAIIGLVMISPIIIDMVMAYKKKSTENGQAPVGMHGLYRTLTTFGIILLVGTVIFYILGYLHTNANNLSLDETLKNLSTILGTALATIIAFYFGIRGTTTAVEKTAQAISGGTVTPDITADKTGSADKTASN